jgi:hypothetical protein
MTREIPDEYEATSGHGLAVNNAGYAANEPHAAIKANPALLPMERAYTVQAGYHWPDAGRDFFQASVVDSKTSPTAVGVSYTGFTDKYEYAHDLSGGAKEQAQVDSPVIRRGTIGIGQAFGGWSFGGGATYTEANPTYSSDAFDRGEERVKGIGLNLGMAATLSPQLRAGASVENATNRKMNEYDPKTYKAGLAYLLSKGVSGFLDYRQRDRVLEFEGDMVGDDEDADKLLDRPEQMVIASLSAQVQDALRLIGSYGQAVGSGDDRRSLAGGVAVVSKNFSLSYTASRPYMKRSTAHQAVSLSLDMAM